MSPVIGGLRVLLWGFDGPARREQLGAAPASACALSLLWGFALGSLLLLPGLLLAFPFFEGSVPAWASPLILAVSMLVMFAASGMLSVMGGQGLRWAQAAAAIAPVLPIQGATIATWVLIMNVTEDQELVAAGVVAVFLLCSHWQAALLAGNFTSLLGVRPLLVAPVAGGVALLGFLLGLLAWFFLFADGSFVWNADFFI